MFYMRFSFHVVHSLIEIIDGLSSQVQQCSPPSGRPPTPSILFGRSASCKKQEVSPALRNLSRPHFSVVNPSPSTCSCCRLLLTDHGKTIFVVRGLLATTLTSKLFTHDVLLLSFSFWTNHWAGVALSNCRCKGICHRQKRKCSCECLIERCESTCVCGPTRLGEGSWAAKVYHPRLHRQRCLQSGLFICQRGCWGLAWPMHERCRQRAGHSAETFFSWLSGFFEAFFVECLNARAWTLKVMFNFLSANIA